MAGTDGVSIRRALVWTTAERYAGLLLNFALIATISRLLTPAEVGIMQLGFIVMTLAETLRDSGSGLYLIQKRQLEAGDARTAFTFTVLVSTAASLIILAGAGAIAAAYAEPALGRMLRIVAPTFLLAPFWTIPIALMRRELAFGTLAVVNIGGWLVNAVAVVGFAALGYSYLSLALAAWVSGVAFTVLGLWARPDVSWFGFTIRGWRPLLRFGAYSAVPNVLHRLYDFVPSLVLGRLISIEALGFFDRAAKISELPEKVGTIGVHAVALPGFANEARAGRSLKQAYLSAVEHVTAVQWPGFLLLALLADPVVQLVLGPQWAAAVPLVRIISLALMANFSLPLSGAVLVAAGHVRDTMMTAMLVLPAMAILFVLAATHGLVLAAASLIVIGLIRAVVSNAYVCRRLGIAPRELACPLVRSAAVSALALLVPLAIAALLGFDLQFRVATAVGIGATALPGWLGGLWVTRHPLGAEIRRIVQEGSRRASTGRLVAPIASRPGGGTEPPRSAE